MTFNLNGWKRILSGPAISTGAGSVKSKYMYVSNDDAATIEGTGYFDAVIDDLAVGDQVDISIDVDGTPSIRSYVVSSVTTHVALSRETAVVVGDQTAIPSLTDSSAGVAGATIAVGVGKRTLAFYVNLADIASGDVLTDYVPGYAFKILSVDFRVSKPATTGSKLATLNMEIGSTNLTGGAVALTSANCTPAGAAVAGSAVTAANTGTATDAFSIEASSVTAFVEGNGWIMVGIQNLDERDAFASLAAKVNADFAMERTAGLLAP